MENPVRGEKEVEFQGNKIVLKLTMNSICKLEASTERSFGMILSGLETWDDVSNISMSELRLLFWALMLDALPDASLEDAGDVIALMGGDYLGFILEATQAAFPKADNTKTGK